MPFEKIATLVAALFAILAESFFVFPDLITAAWGLRLEGDGAFMGQRLAAYFAGGAVMLFLARSAPPSPARRAIAGGVAVSLYTVAVVGVLALVRGEVAGGILLAIAVEVVFGTVLLITGRSVA